jgi:Zn-dependent protease
LALLCVTIKDYIMESSLSLGKIFGIPIRLHFTWFIIFILITASLVASLQVPGPYVLWYRIVSGIITSLLFFLSILVHELAHSLVAIKNNIPVKDITLFVFGGVSRITKEANHPKLEILIALVGPLASICIAAIYLGIYFALSGVDTLLATLALWLVYLNSLMALFNLIPGFPLDGGRILRSIIWHNTGSFIRGTRIATIVGRIIGYIFIAGGIVLMFVANEWTGSMSSSLWTGLWLLFIGSFLEISATISYREALLRDAINGFTARDIMNVNFPATSGEMTIEQLVHQSMLSTGNKWFIVTTENRLQGLISLRNIKKIPQARWNTTTVKEVMVPDSSLFTVHPDEDALYILENMEEKNTYRVPVIENEKIAGIISYDNLMHLPKIRSDLKMYKQKS